MIGDKIICAYLNVRLSKNKKAHSPLIFVTSQNQL